MAKLNKKKVKDAIYNSMGVKSVIAQKCGVSRSALTQFLNKSQNQELEKEILSEKERLLDIAEKGLIDAVKQGEKWAIERVLKTIGRERGYFEKYQVLIEKEDTSLTEEEFREAIERLREK
ncbi:MAG: hypothetical protein ABFQ65_01550 [Nanoarchaeota archaeon]